MGFTDFINKHKQKFILAYVISVLLIFIPPVSFNQFYFEHPRFAMGYSFYNFSIALISIPINLKHSYDYIYKENNITISDFNSYFNHMMPDYSYYVFGTIIFWFIIVSLIILIVQIHKNKKHCKFLLILPLALYIVHVFIGCVFLDLGIPFIGFYLAILIEIFILFYYYSTKHLYIRKPHKRKPTDKERIANLEARITELESKEKDVE